MLGACASLAEPTVEKTSSGEVIDPPETEARATDPADGDAPHDRSSASDLSTAIAIHSSESDSYEGGASKAQQSLVPDVSCETNPQAKQGPSSLSLSVGRLTLSGSWRDQTGGASSLKNRRPSMQLLQPIVITSTDRSPRSTAAAAAAKLQQENASGILHATGVTQLDAKTAGTSTVPAVVFSTRNPQIGDLYDMYEKLGQGTVAFVRRGIRKADGLEVAIKIVRTHDVEMAEIVRSSVIVSHRC